MSASVNDYKRLFGNIEAEPIITMARCACVACNSCTCGCSCRNIPEGSEIEW